MPKDISKPTYDEALLKTIAQKLNISQSTVSEVLSGDSLIKPSMQKMIKLEVLAMNDKLNPYGYKKADNALKETGIAHKVTIYYIANRLEISAATVSRALSGSKKISQNTAAIVMDVAARMGYEPDASARNLRLGNKQTENDHAKNAVTLNDIAEATGFSTSTISRSLNNEPDVGSETRKRIRSVANKLGFTGNSLARELRSASNVVDSFFAR